MVRIYTSNSVYSPTNHAGTDHSSVRPESRSFEEKIRAAKAMKSHIIPEGDLSGYEWRAENLSPQERLCIIEKRAMKRAIRQERRSELEKQDTHANVQLLFKQEDRSYWIYIDCQQTLRLANASEDLSKWKWNSGPYDPNCSVM